MAPLFLLSFSMFWRTRPGAKGHALRRRDTRVHVKFSWVTCWRHRSLSSRRLLPSSTTESVIHLQNRMFCKRIMFSACQPNLRIGQFCSYYISMLIDGAQELFFRFSGGKPPTAVFHCLHRCRSSSWCVQFLRQQTMVCGRKQEQTSLQHWENRSATQSCWKRVESASNLQRYTDAGRGGAHNDATIFFRTWPLVLHRPRAERLVGLVQKEQLTNKFFCKS